MGDIYHGSGPCCSAVAVCAAPFADRGICFRLGFACPQLARIAPCHSNARGGFFLGSIYLNYGLTALISAIFYPLCLFNRILDKTTLMVICVAFSILFPIWFFRYARSLWLGFDHFADPQDF